MGVSWASKDHYFCFPGEALAKLTSQCRLYRRQIPYQRLLRATSHRGADTCGPHSLVILGLLCGSKRADLWGGEQKGERVTTYFLGLQCCNIQHCDAATSEKSPCSSPSHCTVWDVNHQVSGLISKTRQWLVWSALCYALSRTAPHHWQFFVI